jgi:hypothetical protein
VLRKQTANTGKKVLKPRKDEERERKIENFFAVLVVSIINAHEGERSGGEREQGDLIDIFR